MVNRSNRNPRLLRRELTQWRALRAKEGSLGRNLSTGLRTREPYPWLNDREMPP